MLCFLSLYLFLSLPLFLASRHLPTVDPPTGHSPLPTCISLLPLCWPLYSFPPPATSVECGINIPQEKGCEAQSDRDVLLQSNPYYFVEAEIDPASKPLVLWLNRGPGCSSLGAGAFSANGPFRPNDEGLVKNEHSWNKEANMLYLKTPVGVGFSYSSDNSSYVGVGDEATARDNLVFLQSWFNKFPRYKNRDLFLTRESCADGKWKPTDIYFQDQRKM